MANAVRYAVPAVAILTACAAAAGARHLSQTPRDPCEITPEIHACAMFLQPEWMVRRAHAGRVAPATPAIAHVHAPIDTDADTITGSISVSDRAPVASAPEVVLTTGF